jgi:hypothetical protein
MGSENRSWKIRFAGGALLLFIVFLGMVVADVMAEGGWKYWRVMTPVYALVCIGLSLYIRHMKLKTFTVTIWHELFHWLGLLFSVYLISTLVQMGQISRFQGGIEELLLIALATYLAGVYIEPMFVLVGIAIGCLVVTVGFLSEYLYAILFPTLIISIIILYFIVRRKKNLNG